MNTEEQHKLYIFLNIGAGAGKIREEILKSYYRVTHCYVYGATLLSAKIENPKWGTVVDVSSIAIASQLESYTCRVHRESSDYPRFMEGGYKNTETLIYVPDYIEYCHQQIPWEKVRTATDIALMLQEQFKRNTVQAVFLFLGMRESSHA